MDSWWNTTAWGRSSCLLCERPVLVFPKHQPHIPLCMHFIALSFKNKKKLKKIFLFAFSLTFFLSVTGFPPLLLYITMTTRGHHHPTLFFWWGQTSLASADIAWGNTSLRSRTLVTPVNRFWCVKHCWFPFKAYIKCVSGQLDEYCSLY